VDAPAPEEPSGLDGRSVDALRARWRSVSLASGWRFPSDWPIPEVDTVCAAVLRDGLAAVPAGTALAALGRARAATGAGLAETLADLAALHAALANGASAGPVGPDVDATPARTLRLVALAWAEVAVDQPATTGVSDPLTGLPSAAYLNTRLGEVYRKAGREGCQAGDTHTFVVVSLDLAEVTGWTRLVAMILVADTLRDTFDGGETIALLGPSTAAVLMPREGRIASRALQLRRALTERLSGDAHLDRLGPPRIRVVRVPSGHEAACELLERLARS
jgi:GGDEF domain-containing protein